MVARMRRPWLIATVATVSVAVLACGTDDGDAGLPAADGWQRDAATSYHRLATYPVFRNLPAGTAPDARTVAEISAVTEDGETLIYTDAPGKRIGFLDLSDPAAPAGAGSISLEQLGHADDQPTSVAVAGDYVLVVIDSSGGDFAHPRAGWISSGSATAPRCTASISAASPTPSR